MKYTEKSDDAYDKKKKIKENSKKDRKLDKSRGLSEDFTNMIGHSNSHAGY